MRLCGFWGSVEKSEAGFLWLHLSLDEPLVGALSCQAGIPLTCGHHAVDRYTERASDIPSWQCGMESDRVYLLPEVGSW